MLGFPMPPPHFPRSSFTCPPHPNTLSHTSPNTFPYLTISTYLPHTPTHFPTPPPTLSTPPSTLTSPTPSTHFPLPSPHPNTLPYISHHIYYYLPHTPTPFSTPTPTLSHTSLHISLHLPHTQTHFPAPSTLNPYTILNFINFKKNHVKVLLHLF